MDPHGWFAADSLDPAGRDGITAAVEAARAYRGPVWITDHGEVVAELRLTAVEPVAAGDGRRASAPQPHGAE
jgi:hypothetical protein